MANQSIGNDNHFAIDSMPLEVCKLSRSSRSNVCTENIDTLTNHEHCASHDMKFYRNKLHAVCSSGGFLKILDITPASVHDIHYLNDVKQQIKDCIIVGDKGYVSHDVQLDLFRICTINLNPCKDNSLHFN